MVPVDKTSFCSWSAVAAAAVASGLKYCAVVWLESPLTLVLSCEVEEAILDANPATSGWEVTK